MKRKPKPYKDRMRKNFGYFLRQLVGRAPRMSLADKAYYRHKAASIFWSLFCLVIISWVGTNLVVCALSANAGSDGDLIYEAPKEAVLPNGKNLNALIKNAPIYSRDNSSVKTITFDKYTSNNTYFAGGGQPTLSQA